MSFTEIFVDASERRHQFHLTTFEWVTKGESCGRLKRHQGTCCFLQSRSAADKSI